METAIYGRLNNPRLGDVLWELELASRSAKMEDVGRPSGLWVEHVMPQSWSAHWPLNGQMIPQNVATAPLLASGELATFSDAIRQRNSRLHTLGNLTLVNRFLNPAASNGDFQAKLVEYRNSVLRLNRYFDGRVTWADDDIRERGETLGDLICKIWPKPAKS